MPTINDEIPKSRITLTYRTDVQGEPEDVVLPFRILILGDLSKGTSKDRKTYELDKRQIRGLDGKNLNAVIKDMAMELNLEVPDKIGQSATGMTKVQLKLSSMKSFAPAEVAQQVPKIKSLLTLKKLLLEAQASVDNSKAFRTMLMKMTEIPKDASEADRATAISERKARLAALKAELANFSDYAIPPLPSDDEEA